jgi:anti-sigma factor RsiW
VSEEPGKHDQIREMLSAYLDGELTQSEDQRVRIHLEDCTACAREYAALRTLQAAAQAVRFPEPPEEAMDELEQRLSVRGPRALGWIMIGLGALAWLLYALVMAVLHWRPPTFEEMAAAAIVIGVLLLFGSVFRERLLQLPHDRYRRIKR